MRRKQVMFDSPTPPSEETIRTLAERVSAGEVVEADLTDGTFVALMAELQRRGFAPAQRSKAEKWLKPFLFKVERSHPTH